VYQLLTGDQLYQGETVSDTLASVLREEPKLEKVPRRFQALLRRCLEKDPKKRLRDIGDAIALIEPALVESDQSITTPPVPISSRWPWVAAGVSALAAIALSAIHFREKPPNPPAVARYQIQLPEGTRFTNGGGFSLSPDGQ